MMKFFFFDEDSYLPFQTYCSNMTAEAYILSVELDYHTPQPERY